MVKKAIFELREPLSLRIPSSWGKSGPVTNIGEGPKDDHSLPVGD